MSLAYRPPGVTIEESLTPQISPLLSASALVAIVGPACGYVTRTDQLFLGGNTTPVALPGLPTGGALYAVDSVKDFIDPSTPAQGGYSSSTDYQVSTANGTVNAKAGGLLETTGRWVNVQYQYVPANFFDPIRLYDFGSVVSRFGEALNSDGTINSHLTYAASIAFENGADSIVCQPLFTRQTPGNPTTARSNATSSNWATSSTWSDTLYVLRDIEDINVIVPVIGQGMANVTDNALIAIFGNIQTHLYFMQGQDQYIIAILGEDSSTDIAKATKATLQSHATTLKGSYGGTVAEQTVLISPAKYKRALPSGNSIYVGGQYAAAAVAGMLASRAVSSSLTRKTVNGFIEVSDYRSSNDKNEDASAGLFVIESKKGNVQVRHSITTDNTSTARRELSVVRAKHRMIESVKDTLDRQIIGNIVADGNAVGTVEATVIGVLEALRQQKDLVDYSGVQARLLSLDPTTMQVRFSYRPAFPLNYIDVVFSIDLSSGSIVSTPSNPVLAG
jgi:hypothetical protein